MANIQVNPVGFRSQAVRYLNVTAVDTWLTLAKVAVQHPVKGHALADSPCVICLIILAD
jgi:hypothetical protein